jgi:hypothetical protein
MSAVCAACRDSKVKCELLHVGQSSEKQSCERCRRIGLTCKPAEPSQRGKRSSSARLGEQNRRRLVGAAPIVLAMRDSDITQGEVPGSLLEGSRLMATASACVDVARPAASNCAESQRFLNFWTGFIVGPNTVKNSQYCAIQKAGRARHYNRPDFMMMAMTLCKYYGYDVEDVITKSLWMEPVPSTIDEYPPLISTMLRGSSGYAAGRCAAGGVVMCVTNPSFEAAVMTTKELNAEADDPAQACLDMFGFCSPYTHADDAEALSTFTSRMLSADSDAEVHSMQVPSLVRVLDRRMRCYVPCAARGMINFGERKMFLAIEFTPAGTPIPLDPYLSLGSTTATSPQGMVRTSGGSSHGEGQLDQISLASRSTRSRASDVTTLESEPPLDESSALFSAILDDMEDGIGGFMEGQGG